MSNNEDMLKVMLQARTELVMNYLNYVELLSMQLLSQTNTSKTSRDCSFDERDREVMKAKLCKAEIDFTTLVDAIKPKTGVNYCRLDVYLGVQGSEPYIYSTPWTHKGKPFWCEFIVKSTDTAETVADRLTKTIKSNHIFQVDKDLINLTNDGAGKLTLEGANEF